jgi:hypothetical protein
MDDSAYTLRLGQQTTRKKPHYRSGFVAWNRGLSWEQQGFPEESRKKVLAVLKENSKKNNYGWKNRKRPVIQMDEYDNRLHWYESSEAAARKLGVIGRNIRKVCDGERNFCGGYRWCWDKRFL